MKKSKRLHRDRYIEWHIRNFDPNEPGTTPGPCPFLSHKKARRYALKTRNIDDLIWEQWDRMTKKDVLREWRKNRLEYVMPAFLDWAYEDPWDDDF